MNEIQPESAPQPTDLVVGGTSRTGSKQTDILLSQRGKNVVSTGTKATIYNFGDDPLHTGTVGLSLKNLSEIQKGILGPGGIYDHVGDVFAFGSEVQLTLHAMSMGGMSESYPKEIVEVLEGYSAQVSSVLYISYEGPYSEDTPDGSHVFYPVRAKKQNMERSALESCQQAKIIDLITFDSPSAKKLGFTFLGIVGDFVMFMEKNPDNYISKQFRSVLQGFLGEDYQGIQDLFKQYPLRGNLDQGQQSMKKMAEEGTLNAMISSTASDINFAKFSRISGLITDLYLALAMNDMTKNRQEILSSTDSRVLLDWERISKVELPDGELESIVQELHIQTAAKLDSNDLEQNTVFVQVSEDSQNQSKSYVFDPEKIDFLGNHFGIIPYFLMLQMLDNAGFLSDTEYIKLGQPKSMIYAGNTITIERSENKIFIINPDNRKEVFCEFEIGSYQDMDQPKLSDTYFSIPQSKMDKKTGNCSFPHSMSWAKTFIESIPTSFQGVSFSKRNSIIEHIGFQIANSFLNNTSPDNMNTLKDIFKGMKKFDPKEISGRFSKVVTEFQSTDLEQLLETGHPDVRITKAAYGMGSLNISVEIIQEEQLLGKYKLMFT